MLDVVIVGAGPAGLAAALTLGRARRDTLVLDHGAPRNAPADAVHNVLSRDGTPPDELRRIGMEQATAYPTVEIRGEGAASIEPLPDGAFAVHLHAGTTVVARRVLLATGVIDRLPAIDGLAALWGRSVYHCPYCHGYEARDKRLLALGGTDALAQLALHLTRFSNDVVVGTNGEHQIAPLLLERLRAAAVPVETDPVARLTSRNGALETVVFTNGRSIARDAVFAATTLEQRSSLPASLGCAIDGSGLVAVSMLGQTSVPGVYAAGDMARNPVAPLPSAVISAAASGTLAGAAIDKDLLAIDFALTEPAYAAR